MVAHNPVAQRLYSTGRAEIRSNQFPVFVIEYDYEDGNQPSPGGYGLAREDERDKRP